MPTQGTSTCVLAPRPDERTIRAVVWLARHVILTVDGAHRLMEEGAARRERPRRVRGSESWTRHACARGASRRERVEP